jgi:hypothetical protein
MPITATRMICCVDCGNKRCPKATDHQLTCTGSNAAEQSGSRFMAGSRSMIDSGTEQTGADLHQIPSRGFIRGSIVRRQGAPPNMLVVRGLEDTTVVILCEGDAGGTLRLREVPTDDLVQVLGHN